MRRITVNGQEWKYAIGITAAIVVPPNGIKSIVPLSKLTNKTQNANSSMVTTVDIKNYITNL